MSRTAGRWVVGTGWTRAMALLGGLLGPLLGARPAAAATRAVTNLNDSGAGSLRQAIGAAAPGDTITFGVAGTIGLGSSLNVAQDLTIRGPGARQLTISGNHVVRILHAASGTLSLSGLTLDGGVAPGNGGAARVDGTLRLTDCTVTGNAGSRGGAFYNHGGTLVLTRCTLAGNSSRGAGGAIDNHGQVTLDQCTLAGNVADYNPFSNSNSFGGALYNDGGQVTVHQCTISGNRAYSGGGGLANRGASSGGQIAVSNSLIAGNSDYPGAPDVEGGFSSGGHNLIGTGNGAFGFTAPGDQVGTASAPIDPRLGPLQDNGGPTPTLALLPHSPALDQADPAQAPATDQRGFARSGAPDVGAFELDGTPPAGAVPNLYIGDAATREGDSGPVNLTFAVRRSFASSQTVTVDFATQDGTATAGSDYKARSGTLTFAPTDALAKNIAVAVIPDTVGEPDETLGLLLSNPVNAALARASGSAILFNDDPYTLRVTNNNDSGPGSLRQVIADLPVSAGIVAFAPNVTGTITLSSGELLLNHDMTIRGPGAGVLTVSGTASTRVFEVASGDVYIAGLTIDGGNVTTVSSVAGGLYNYSHDLTVFNCTFSNNVASSGGAIFTSGAMTLNACRFTGNAAYDGGAVYNYGKLNINRCLFSGNTGNHGGAIYNGELGSLVLRESTLANNSGFDGGAFINFRGQADLRNCTLANNTGQFGGGATAFFGTLNLTNCTVSGNSVTRSTGGFMDEGIGGGIYNNTFEGAVILTNTIVAGNLAANQGPDLYGTINTNGYNVVGDGAASSGIRDGVKHDQVGSSSSPLDAKLEPLQDNGGPTPTMALLPGSPAINAGNDLPAPPSDQRGYSRVGPSDVGAFEFGGVAPVG